MVSPALATIVATSLARGGSSVLESGAVAVAATSSANHGTTPSSLYDKFHAHTPEPLRFFCSANSGNAVLYVLERVFFALLQDKTLPGMLNQQKGSVSFFLAYLFHVVPQHFFLAFFVYGLHTMSTKEKYWRTLRGTYQTLFVAMIGSTLLNGYLLNMGMNRTVSFFVTLSVFACLNFFVLRSLVAKSEAKARDEQEGGKGGRAQVNDKNNNAPMIPPKSSEAHAFVVNKGGPPVKVD